MSQLGLCSRVLPSARELRSRLAPRHLPLSEEGELEVLSSGFWRGTDLRTALGVSSASSRVRERCDCLGMDPQPVSLGLRQGLNLALGVVTPLQCGLWRVSFLGSRPWAPQPCAT